jgi:thiamine biosynthesis lipoprotein
MRVSMTNLQSPQQVRRTPAVRCLLPLLFAFVAGCGGRLATPATQPSLQKFEYHALKLGSDFNLIFYAADKPSADAAADAVWARVDQLDLVYSDYNPESELSRLARRTHDGPMAEPVPVSDNLWKLLRLSYDAAERTGGAFDITVGPYVQLWRRSRRQQQLPSPERLAEAKTSVGWRLMKLDDPKHTVQLLAPKMRLDLGGIAGGYIADDVLRLLRGRGINRAIVDSSGDLALGDPPPDRAGWRVAIRDLTEPSKTAEYIEVANCGVSTSGDTYRFVEIDGVRYSHIVDPATGLGLTHRIGVTTVAPDGVTADWVTKPVSVWGSEKGIAFVETMRREPGMQRLAARVTRVDGERATVVTSGGYQQLKILSATTPAASSRAQ